MDTIFPSNSPLDDYDDASLWKAFKDGNKIAFESLYRRFFKALLKTGLLICNSKELVMDCIHDLFVDLWKSRNNLAVPYSVRAYLASSLRRRIIRCLARTVNSTYMVTGEKNVSESPEEVLVATQMRHKREYYLSRAFDCLTRRQKEAIFLKFFVNLDYSEISYRMSISKESVYNLISKAIDNLRIELSSTPLRDLNRI